MKACRTALAAMLLIMGAGFRAAAQTPDLEPGVQTSPASAQAVPSSQPQPQRKPERQPAASAAAAALPAPKPATGPAAQTAGKAGPKSQDRIELDTTQISGNRELPKVMYVVPWRRADPGEFAGRPPNSLLDEALTPVDREVFLRQNRYYAALEAGPAASGTPASQTSSGSANPKASESKDEK